jgi:hypothetical protein
MRFRICKNGKLDTDPHQHHGDKECSVSTSGSDTHKIKIMISVSVLFVGACPQQVVRRGGLVARDDHTSLAPKTYPVGS